MANARTFSKPYTIQLTNTKVTPVYIELFKNGAGNGLGFVSVPDGAMKADSVLSNGNPFKILANEIANKEVVIGKTLIYSNNPNQVYGSYDINYSDLFGTVKQYSITPTESRFQKNRTVVEFDDMYKLNRFTSFGFTMEGSTQVWIQMYPTTSTEGIPLEKKVVESDLESRGTLKLEQ